MSGQLALVMGDLDGQPNVTRGDIEGVARLLDAINDDFAGVHNDVVVERAVLELTNASGYPVGYVSFDGETQLYRFTPRQNEKA